MAILFDIITEIPVDVYSSTKITHEHQYTETKTNILAPNISPQYSVIHNPILQFNSPSGSIGGSPINQTPAVSPHIATDPYIAPTQSANMSDTADMGDVLGGGGSGIMDLLLLAGVVIGAIILIPLIFKRKKKKKEG